MKILHLLLTAQKQLQQKNITSFALDALLLLQHATSLSKEQIIFNPNSELDKEQENLFWQLIERRKNREPISHIINKREFYGLDFFVSGDVLDPRPDSESLIELVLEIFGDKNSSKNYQQAQNQQLQILELGVGSGCLIISLLKNLPNASAIGVDISAKAIQIAKQNAVSNQVENRLQFFESDLFANISLHKTDSQQEDMQNNAKNNLQNNHAKNHQQNNVQKFDLIISNPPYIEAAQIENLADEVRLFEPRLALDGGIDGYDFYRRIAADCKKFLKPLGLVVVEVGDNQSPKVQEIFAENKLNLKTSKRDLAGFERALGFVAATTADHCP